MGKSKSMWFRDKVGICFQSVWCLLSLSLMASMPSSTHAENITVAVAANFTKTMRELSMTFENRTGHRVRTSFASTGQLYAQIIHGAPFDIFMAADTKRPDKLILEGLAQRDSSFIYAQGRLALWSANSDLALDHGKILQTHSRGKKQTSRLALPNPKLAPYGAAALETLNVLGAYPYWQSRLITGQSVAQTHQFIASGNVALGFIALSQAIALPQHKQGIYWVVPEKMHTPIDQKAVLLTKAIEKPGAQLLMQFLKSPEAGKIIEGYGYSISKSLSDTHARALAYEQIVHD